MEEFIKLIQDIGFVKSIEFDRADDIISYKYNKYIIFIIFMNYKLTGLKLDEPKWSMAEINGSSYNQCLLIKESEFLFDEIDLLKINFKSYFRDSKLKELGI